MARTLTPPPTDRAMWRKLLRLAHPDGGGDHDVFVWARNLQEHVSEARAGAIPDLPPADVLRQHKNYPGNRPRPGHVPFDTSTDDLVRRAMSMVAEDGIVEPRYGHLLSLLEDYPPTGGEDEEIGASYRILAAIAYRVDMDQAERSRWYRVAEFVPLSQAHAKHIIGRIKVGGWVA